MNSIELLNHVVMLLQTEGERGQGTMFLIIDQGHFVVTRTPPNCDPDAIVASYDCRTFTNGLSARQYASLMFKAEKAYLGKS
jgi:hypothetical protein